ncbi:Membrane protein of unknown function [Modestobacter italicus]|uniref:O-antigen polymerase n=1 Tax=Modestobacter italicus (strain DSM 44449 / CECT 9708 / BC 501) TaxID=2732864 RepID=I4EXK4_MODI5|nr:Membrane protein of unknown function [Modestobacter marinus]
MVLFGYVLARPVSSNQVLVPVLALMGALAAGAIVLARRQLAGPLLPVLLTTFAFGLTGLAAGPTNPGVFSGVLVFVAAPLLWWMVATAVDERMLRAAFTVAALVTIWLGGTIAVFVAQSTGGLPDVLPSWVLDQYGAAIGGEYGAVRADSSDYTQIRFYGLTTLVATGPMWVASLVVPRDPLLPPQWLRVVAAVAATAGTLAAGRRALALVLIVSPLLAWAVKAVLSRSGEARLSRRQRRGLGVGAVTTVVLLYLTPGASGIVTAAVGGLAGYVTGDDDAATSSPDDVLRTYQADRLLDAWSSQPVFGHGFGAVLNDFSRSVEEPWRWELQYHALLFWTGLVGVLLVVAGAALTLNAVVRGARARPDLVPSMVVACTAAAGMLIANATNPYLQAPARVWSIFLPVAIANVMLISAARRPDGPGGRSPTARDRVRLRAQARG